MTPEQIRAVRRLDVKFAHAFNRTTFGHPFLPGPSDANGRWYDADENALIALHKVRTKVGTKKQIRESKDWLRKEGLMGLFEQPLELHS